MSMPHEIIVNCAGCGTAQTFTAWKSLNVTIDPEQKQKVITGELTRFTCEKCRWSGPVVYPFLYHDMKKQLMIWLWTEPGDPDLRTVPEIGMMRDYHCRLVATQNDLIEKILISEAGLDDRAVEFLKLCLQVQAAGGKHPLDGKLYFGQVEKNPAGAEIVGFEHLTGNGNESFAIPKEAYDKLAASLQPKFGAINSPRWLRVDQNFAKGLLA